jgi:hypothetical protein
MQLMRIPEENKKASDGEANHDPTEELTRSCRFVMLLFRTRAPSFMSVITTHVPCTVRARISVNYAHITLHRRH